MTKSRTVVNESDLEKEEAISQHRRITAIAYSSGRNKTVTTYTRHGKFSFHYPEGLAKSADNEKQENDKEDTKKTACCFFNKKSSA